MRKIGQTFSFFIPVIALTALVIFIIGCAGQEKAQEEENKIITNRFYEEIWNQGKLDVIDEIFAAEFVHHEPGVGEVYGPGSFKKYISMLLTAFPEVQLTIEDQIAKGDNVVTRWTCTGTHKGKLAGILPTGVQVTWTGIDIFRIAGDNVMETWVIADDFRLFRQLGYKMNPPLTETTFARVTLTQGKVDMMNETIQIYKDSVVPAAQSQNGYRGIYLLNNFKTGKAISISLWDSEEDAIANEQSGYYQEQVGKFKDFYTAKPVQEGYVVTVQE